MGVFRYYLEAYFWLWISLFKATFVLFVCSGSVSELPRSPEPSQTHKYSGRQRSAAATSVHISEKTLRFIHPSSSPTHRERVNQPGPSQHHNLCYF